MYMYMYVAERIGEFNNPICINLYFETFLSMIDSCSCTWSLSCDAGGKFGSTQKKLVRVILSCT